MDAPDIGDIRAAARRIAASVHCTPVVTSRTLDDIAGCSLHLKCENLQRTGAFKIRGATNAVAALSDEVAARGVATHSSGNHAAAVALAARSRGVPAHIVMPSTAPEVKKAAVAGYGADITFTEPTVEAREAALADVIERTGATWIPSYDHPDVVAGQGTAALELLEQVPALDAVVTPVGGGGLLSGTALAVTAIAPGTRVVAGEPAGADDAARSLAAGRLVRRDTVDSLCDGLLMPLSELTFGIIREHVERIVVVDDAAAVRAMRLLWERTKLVVEVSSAVALAAVLESPEIFADRRVGVVLSGGNVDLDRLPWQEPGAGS